MKNKNEKSVSLSKEVRALIDINPYVRNTLADGLINYSALARMLAPRIKQDLNREVKEESLIVAIKRYADEINGKTDKKDYLDIISKSAISMQDEISYALFNRSDEVLNQIEALLNESDGHRGEIRIIIDAPSRVIAVLKTHRMGLLMGKVGDAAVDYSNNKTLITMREPIESRNTYGVIAEITSALSKRGISIELVSAPPDLHFIVNEANAGEAYKCLRQMVNDAKQAVEANNHK